MNFLKVCFFFTFILSSTYSIKLIDLNQIDSHWTSFKKLKRKNYNNETHESRRKEIFRKTLRNINKQNSRFNKGEITYKSGINEFSDWTPEEFMNYVNKGLSLDMINNMTTSLLYQNESKINSRLNNLPASIDWRTKGIVNTIKDQGKCGSCWAFSVNAIIESYSAMITGVVPTLSEQNLVDCTYFRYDGCGGGWMTDAFDYISINKGISFGYAYPYVSGVTGRVSVFDEIFLKFYLNFCLKWQGKCKYNSRLASGSRLIKYNTLPAGDENKLQETIANIGPLSVSLYVSNNFQSYSSGVFKDTNCNLKFPNHAVALVGYDTDSNGNQYYILRNQWGTSWGMNGYMYFARNNNNMCGIADNAFYVNVNAVLTGNEDIPAYYLTSSKMSINSFQNCVLFNLILSYYFV